MGPKPRTPKSDDLFRQRLDELVNPRHPLAQLSQHIDWSVFEDEWSGFFPSHRGRPATAPRLVAGLLYATHLCPIGRRSGVEMGGESLLAIVLWRNLVPAPATD